MRTCSSLLLILLAAPLAAQHALPPVGSIDVYGVQQVSESAVRRAVGIAPGDLLPDSAAKVAILTRLRAIPGVDDAKLFAICCEGSGRTMVFVGIAEPGTPRPRFRAAPTGSAHLPAEILARDSVFSQRFIEAIRAGRNAEADSGGHEFFADSALNAMQHQYLAFAATRIPLLRDVLAHSASATQRVLAAELLDYAPDVRTVIPDLVAAMDDPVSDVRNAAMRALWVIAAFAQKEPALDIHVPTTPFIDKLWSLDWTDRNKASLALSQLTLDRDRELLAELRRRALRPLLDIARWTDPGHAFPGVVMLGRIEGRSDPEIFAAIQRGDRASIIAQAVRMLRERDAH
ncbi:MAG: hypothetical protein ACREMS_07365 [Gemmatimonadaceae bacterium]